MGEIIDIDDFVRLKLILYKIIDVRKKIKMLNILSFMSSKPKNLKTNDNK